MWRCDAKGLHSISGTRCVPDGYFLQKKIVLFGLIRFRCLGKVRLIRCDSGAGAELDWLVACSVVRNDLLWRQRVVYFPRKLIHLFLTPLLYDNTLDQPWTITTKKTFTKYLKITLMLLIAIINKTLQIFSFNIVHSIFLNQTYPMKSHSSSSSNVKFIKILFEWIRSKTTIFVF